MSYLNSIGEPQTREVGSHAGLWEKHFQKNSTCSLWIGKKWNLMEENQGQCCQKENISRENSRVEGQRMEERKQSGTILLEPFNLAINTTCTPQEHTSQRLTVTVLIILSNNKTI